jgi:hypothetical protein
VTATLDAERLMPSTGSGRRIVVAAIAAWVVSLPGRGAAEVSTKNGAPITVTRITEPIRIDGQLDDPGWQNVPAIDGWYETNPGDNLPASVGCTAKLAYDHDYLYAAFDFGDPNPGAIRCPLGDHDELPGSTDYGGVILDSRNDGKTAQMFLANARGLQYDAITNDATGEDNSPDFYWDTAGRVTDHGWQLEMRIPFASIRYVGSDPEQWAILLYRNRPRDFRYQYFSSRLPRDTNCFVCNGRALVGLQGLPSGTHWVVAPFATASQTAVPESLGTSLHRDDPDFDAGVDLKWVPNPDIVLDAAINPDFSQIESDEGQITANERFAIFQEEKRPFFLEGKDLFATPISAVYTRTFTDPRWGARGTAGFESSKFTFLAGQDHGGGTVILPGPTGSDYADQDYESWVSMGRVRRDIGASTAGFLYTGREIDGGGSNRVLGPDFTWRPNDRSTLTGQFLYSFSHTPNRPDLASEWDGRELQGHGAEAWYSYSNGHFDWFGVYDDFSDDFRADNGFVSRVGFRGGRFDTGYTFWPQSGPVRRLRLFTQGDASNDRHDNELTRWIGPGFGLDATWNTFVRMEFNFDEVRGDVNLHKRFYVVPTLQMRPGKIVNNINITGTFGDQVDYSTDEDATGGNVIAVLDLRPTDHLRLTTSYRRRWLDGDVGGGVEDRLFTAQIPRLRAVYSFNSRSWLRVIGEWSETTSHDSPRVGDFGGSAVFAYKLNWQTVLFLGYSDLRELDDRNEWQASERNGFFKVSYAFRG